MADSTTMVRVLLAVLVAGFGTLLVVYVTAVGPGWASSPWFRVIGAVFVFVGTIFVLRRLGFPLAVQIVAALIAEAAAVGSMLDTRGWWGDAWPRPYRWRREVNRVMARERAARPKDD